jgi:predicted Zn-dependent peptidase
MVVSAAGAVEHDAIVEQVAGRFASIGREPPPAPEGAVYTGGDRRKTRTLEQAHLVLGFRGLAWSDPDHYAMHVFSNLLGGGMSSRLFQEIREKRGLCYEIYSFFSPFSDDGVFGIYGGTGETSLGDFVPLVLDTLTAAIAAPTEAEVARAKAQMKVALLTALESPGRRAEQMARHVLAYGRVLTRVELSALIDAISVEDVRRVGAKILSAPPSIAAIGPVRKLASSDAVSRRVGAPMLSAG